MKKTHVRGITDKELSLYFSEVERRFIMLGSRAIKQRGYNRTMGVALGVMWVVLLVHVAYFHFAGYYAWVGLWMDALTGGLL